MCMACGFLLVGTKELELVVQAQCVVARGTVAVGAEIAYL